MAREILPTASDGVELTTTKSWVGGAGESTTTKQTGSLDNIETLYEAAKVDAVTNSLISQINFHTNKGKAEVTIIKTPSELDPAQNETGTQELSAVDVVRPIYAAPYFSVTSAAPPDGTGAALTHQEIGDVRRSVEDGNRTVLGGWNAKQQQLFKFIVQGRTTYFDTAYIFRKVFPTSGGVALQRSAANNNTVQPLPTLSTQMSNMIEGLPDGEWLKRPTKVRYLGRQGFEVTEEYHWAPQWSIVYGGTFVGT